MMPSSRTDLPSSLYPPPYLSPISPLSPPPSRLSGVYLSFLKPYATVASRFGAPDVPFTVHRRHELLPHQQPPRRHVPHIERPSAGESHLPHRLSWRLSEGFAKIKRLHLQAPAYLPSHRSSRTGTLTLPPPSRPRFPHPGIL